jgi:uncharacterized SAM-binding protein YcdF (DUF218 family)
MNAPTLVIPDELRAHVKILWDYHDLHHELHTCDIGVGLGSHDLGVADHLAELHTGGYFPLAVFTGANAPTTVERFPRGEAVHYRERALELGVPDAAILVEPCATNTAENIEFTRELLAEKGIIAESLLLVSRPYQQRRAFATAKKIWPDVDIICSSQRTPLDDYVRSIGDVDRVINMLVGDTQRITVYANRGFAIAQDLPGHVDAAYQRLVDAGYTARLIAE